MKNFADTDEIKTITICFTQFIFWKTIYSYRFIVDEFLDPKTAISWMSS